MVNVGTLMGRCPEAVETLGMEASGYCNIIGSKIQERRSKAHDWKRIRIQTIAYWKGEKTGQGWIVLVVNKTLVDYVVEVRQVC